MQIDLFSYINPPYKIKKPIRLIELFAGIGSQYQALKNIGADVESYRIVEFDKFAVKSYNAIHGTDHEAADITKISCDYLKITERDIYTYIMTYSFPCQDLSQLGKTNGMAKGAGTRSGLLWEVERLLDELNGNLPQVLLMENVPQVIGTKNISHFQEWRRKLESLGYSNFVQLLNAKDYGIPQKRERCFMVSVLGKYHYGFPDKKVLDLSTKDMIEKEPCAKYYVSDKAAKYIKKKGRQIYPVDQNR